MVVRAKKAEAFSKGLKREYGMQVFMCKYKKSTSPKGVKMRTSL